MFKYLVTLLYWVACIGVDLDLDDEPGRSADLGPDPEALLVFQKHQSRPSLTVITVFFEGDFRTRRRAVGVSSRC